MFRKVRLRLTLLFTIFTGTILIITLNVSYHFFIVKSKTHQMESLISLTYNIANQIQSTNVITNSMVCEMEQSKSCMIYLEDNGSPVPLKEGYQSATDRTSLFEMLRITAINDQFSLTSCYGSNSHQSRLYKIDGSKQDTYFGNIVVIPHEDTFLVLMILYSLDELDVLKHTLILTNIVLAVIACLLLWLISYYLISRILRVIDDNNKKQTEFIACASHELRSPLAYIKAANSTLLKECIPFMTEHPKDYLKSYIANTEDECCRMSDLIEDMLLLASADSKTWTIQACDTDMDLFLIDSFEKLSPQCEQKNHTLQLKLPDDMLGSMSLDSHRMYQILQILVNNAVSYTAENSEICIKVSGSKKVVNLQVIDHGTGLSEEQKKRIFDRYYRVDQARSDKSHFGLGLSIAKELVHLQGGKLSVDDTPGGGATFTIQLYRQ